MKFNNEIQQNFNTISNIIILLILIFGAVGYSVGFHFPNEILPGQFANGNYSFNGSVDVNGNLRGKSIYSIGTSISGNTTSQTTVKINAINTTLNVSKNDLVRVDLTCNALNSGTGTNYMWSALTLGNATELSSGRYGLGGSGNNWFAIANNALYKANSDTTLNFNAYWYVSNGIGRYYYCKIFAYVMGMV